MTENRTSLSKKGTRCRVCTGCGRCFGEKKPDVVSSFLLTEKDNMQDEEHLDVMQKEQQGEYLVAVDIGTTTIAMQLLNIKTGELLQTYTCQNPQKKYGADVLSRIQAAEDGVAKAWMKHAVREVLQQGVTEFQKRLPQKGRITGMAVAANTTMLHLLMGYDVSKLGHYPFLPQTLESVKTKIFGIDTVLLPGISAFVGADIQADIYALSMHQRKEITLLLDLGTNGEMVLGNRDKLVATATAAGPAFEGGVNYYGADLMALTARLLQEGLLDSTGLLDEPYFEEGIEIGGVHITQQDIRKLQLAKAAIAAGIQILCRKYGLQDFSEIDRVFLAGGMGYYLDVSAAAAIGLIPMELKDKTKAVGNAALRGAFLYGKEQPAPCMVTEFNLAEEPEFDKLYVDAMMLTPSSLCPLAHTL